MVISKFISRSHIYNIRYKISVRCAWNMLLYEGGTVNTLRPRQNGRHFADNFRGIFFNENAWISIKIAFDPKGLINNDPAFVRMDN